MSRSTKEMRKLVLDELDRAKGPGFSAQRANAVARLVSTVMQTMNVEIQMAAINKTEVKPIDFD